MGNSHLPLRYQISTIRTGLLFGCIYRVRDDHKRGEVIAEGWAVTRRLAKRRARALLGDDADVRLPDPIG